MDENAKEDEDSEPVTLEHADTRESYRQLWWTIGVTVTGLAAIAYFYL